MLDELRCEACSAGAIGLTSEEQQQLLSELDGWALIHRDGIAQLEKRYRFKTLNKRGHSLIKLLNWQNKNFIIRPFY